MRYEQRRNGSNGCAAPATTIAAAAGRRPDQASRGPTLKDQRGQAGRHAVTLRDISSPTPATRHATCRPTSRGSGRRNWIRSARLRPGGGGQLGRDVEPLPHGAQAGRDRVRNGELDPDTFEVTLDDLHRDAPGSGDGRRRRTVK